MGEVSGCYVVYNNGRSGLDRPGYVRIVGRERDVENAGYLIVFLQRALVCIDDFARVKQAKKFFLLDNKVTDATSNAQYDANSLKDGQNDANHLQIMSAVNNQSEIKELANLSR